MSLTVYQRGWQMIASGAMKWDANLKAMLVRSTYTPNADHDYIADLAAYEVSGPGCTAGFGASGRKTLTGAAVTVDDTNNRATLSGPASLIWNGINTATVGGVVIVREMTSDADSPLVMFCPLPAITPGGGTLTVTFADGIVATVE